MSTVATQEKLLTIEEFEQLPPVEAPRELVRGRVLQMNVPYAWHGFVCGKVFGILWEFIEQHQLGIVLCNDAGIITTRNPDSLRGADVSFYSFQKVPKGSVPKKGWLNVPPDLAVEVRSHEQRWKEILEKVAEYLNVGVAVVCVVDPQRQTVTVYEADQPERTVTRDEELTLPTVLPGFSVPVQRFFE